MNNYNNKTPNMNNDNNKVPNNINKDNTPTPNVNNNKMPSTGNDKTPNKNITTVLILIIVIGGFWLLMKNKQPTILDNANIENQDVDLLNDATLGGTEIKEIIKLDNQDKIMNVTFNTNKGSFTVELFETQTPKTVANFVKLAKSNFYDGVKFHRVIKGFMIQGGDPLTKDDSKMSLWGTGGPGYQFADEITSTNKNNAGTISMANAGPNTNGSQFFINTNDNNFLDTKHTVFGRVISGMDVITSIENTETGPNDRPIEAVVINSIVLK